MNQSAGVTTFSQAAIAVATHANAGESEHDFGAAARWPRAARAKEDGLLH
jgi:hypothetical protein